MASIRLKKAGVMSTIQDSGRSGFAALGVPQSGPMDLDSFMLANRLMRRPSGAACLELYMGGVEMIFDTATQVVFTGAVGKITYQGTSFSGNQIIHVHKGEVLTIAPPAKGQWAYMAINGNFAADQVLGSRSFYPGITQKAKFANNDRIVFYPKSEDIPNDHAKIKPLIFTEYQCLEAYPGPSFAQLNEQQRRQLGQNTFTLSQAQSRMGIQLEEKMIHELKELISAPVYPGTVQLTPSGKLIVLMKDAQVTGGYPRILQLSWNSLSKLAQLRPSGKIRFKILFY
ncbi:biotin-dependent carboxyltransferase family protein [Cyclobacterium plantarum]|uniref:5-oxoprolinase subunit C family protein n=1 Tax=Cyclobacterium plantarum TaxID=2716263 RepID=UPI003F70E71A